MTTPTQEVASQRQQLWEVEGFDGYFGTKTGGERSADTSDAWDGGELEPETMSSPATTDNVVLSRPYRPALHREQLRALDKVVGRKRLDVTGHDTDPDLGPVGDPLTYANALLVRLAWPDHDASSADPGTFELEFKVRGLT